jgi:hypothetical protein
MQIDCNQKPRRRAGFLKIRDDYFTSINSTSNSNVALAGITGG